MTEREYINATNLAKVRILEAVMRDVLPSADSTRPCPAKEWRAVDAIPKAWRKVAG